MPRNANHLHSLTCLDSLAGNSWYGSMLAVWWFYCSPPNGREYRGSRFESPNPIPLEKISPIRDGKLLRRSPLKFNTITSNRRGPPARSTRSRTQSISVPPMMITNPHNVVPTNSPNTFHPRTITYRQPVCTPYGPASLDLVEMVQQMSFDPQQASQIQQAIACHMSGSNAQYLTQYPSIQTPPYSPLPIMSPTLNMVQIYPSSPVSTLPSSPLTSPGRTPPPIATSSQAQNKHMNQSIKRTQITADIDKKRNQSTRVVASQGPIIADGSREAML
jgi:hypothetical protein